MQASDEELEALLASDETDRVEKTESVTNTDKFGEAICAFANDLAGHRRPGYLFVGALPSGRASGITVTDQLLQNLAALRDQGNVLPQPSMTVQRRKLGGGEMAVVEVLPSAAPPVRYKQVVWVRVGPRKGRASEQDERVLMERRAVQARTWDMRPCLEATVEDLALDLFALSYRNAAIARDVIDENHRPVERQLAALRFYDLRANRPTNAGVLLFGKDPRFFMPGAYVQYVQYRGTTQAAEVTRERRFTGDYRQVLADLRALARDLAEERPVPDEGETMDRTVSTYPDRAITELLMNAVVHRNYESNAPVFVNHFEDRLEIMNPGGLYGDVTPESFPHASDYRNPVLAEAAKVLGFVNRFGRGIDLVQATLSSNGSRPAEFEPTQNNFLARVWRRA